MADILAALVPAVQQLLRCHGLEDEDVVDPFAEATPLLAGWAAASVQGLAMTGTERQRPTRLGGARPPSTPPACHARWEGFDLHAGVRIPAGHRDRLERVCRYALRPPVAGDHLHLTAAGDVASTSGVRGTMARRISCSHRWRFSRAWRSWCLARESI